MLTLLPPVTPYLEPDAAAAKEQPAQATAKHPWICESPPEMGREAHLRLVTGAGFGPRPTTGSPLAAAPLGTAWSGIARTPPSTP